MGGLLLVDRGLVDEGLTQLLVALYQIINSLAKGRPADAALLAAGIRPPRPTNEEPLHPSSEPQLIAHTAGVAWGEGDTLQVHKAAFFFKLERELEKVRFCEIYAVEDDELMSCRPRSTRSTTSVNRHSKSD